MKARFAFLLVVAACVTARAQTSVPPSQAVAAQAVASRAKAAADIPPQRVAQPLTRMPADSADGSKAPVRTTANRRDPFVSPIVRTAAVSGVPCQGGGKKCLSPGQIVLRGVVRAPDGMIAVVEATGRKISYFLRENDPVFNGYVVRITADSVVFRENTSDHLGRQGTRDVVKKLIGPSV